MTLVVGTAGHIDHGKTTLLRALTGIDADRLPEERERGMTIDVGYAHLVLADGTEIDFVDVPGHDGLVGNMLVGAGEIDAALLVVAADDGPRAQTIEHLELLDGLGIDRGVVAITKTDLVGSDRAEEVTAAVRALLERTTLAGAALVPVSAPTGSDIDALRDALAGLRSGDPGSMARDDDGAPPVARLSVDRVFGVRGRGTVVTGTLRGEPIRQGDRLRLVPGSREPAVRVREVQVHGRTVELGGRGRVALNVALPEGTDRARRGDVLTMDDGVVASDRWLVALRPPADLSASAHRAVAMPSDRTRVVVHLGTAHANAMIGGGPRDRFALRSGETTAILRLAEPLAVVAGDRFVLRRPSPAATLAGGRVLDPTPPRGVARRRATVDRLERLAAARPRSAAWTAARLDLHGVAIDDAVATAAPDIAAAIDADVVATVGQGDAAAPRSRVVETVRRMLIRLVGSAALGGQRTSLSPASPVGRLIAARIDALVASGGLERDGDRLRDPAARSSGPTPELLGAMDRLVDRLATVAPPPLREAARGAGCPDEGIRLLEASNRIVRLDDDLAWAFPTYRDLAGRAVAMAAVAPLTPAAYRDATGTSRKYVMAILEDLDRRAILTRTPAGHVPGPRARVHVT